MGCWRGRLGTWLDMNVGSYYGSSTGYYVPGPIPQANLDLGAASLTVNGAANLVNSVANSGLNLLGAATAPLDRYSGEINTLATSGLGSLGPYGQVAGAALLGTTRGLSATAALIRAETITNTAARAAELRNAIPAAQQGRITMGVGLAEDASGATQVLIGTSEPRGYLRPGVTLNPGETLVRGSGHAEANIVNYAQENGLNLLEVGATRPICPACAAAIEAAGAKPVTPLKVP